MSNQYTNQVDAVPMGFEPKQTGVKLRCQRIKRNLSQDRLCDELSKLGYLFSRNAVSLWENGKKTPSVWTLCLLAAYYGCSLDDLVAYSPPNFQRVASGSGPVHAPKANRSLRASAGSNFLVPTFPPFGHPRGQFFCLCTPLGCRKSLPKMVSFSQIKKTSSPELL